MISQYQFSIIFQQNRTGYSNLGGSTLGGEVHTTEDWRTPVSPEGHHFINAGTVVPFFAVREYMPFFNRVEEEYVFFQTSFIVKCRGNWGT